MNFRVFFEKIVGRFPPKVNKHPNTAHNATGRSKYSEVQQANTQSAW